MAEADKFGNGSVAVVDCTNASEESFGSPMKPIGKFRNLFPTKTTLINEGDAENDGATSEISVVETARYSNRGYPPTGAGNTPENGISARERDVRLAARTRPEGMSGRSAGSR